MKISSHFLKQMNMGGFTADMINTTFVFGTPKNDRIILTRGETKELMHLYSGQKNLLAKIADKGGITLVIKDDTLLTVYNCNYNNGKRMVR